MAINPNQISVAKIYPGNYTNVLRYWHDPKSVTYLNENGTSDQPARWRPRGRYRPSRLDCATSYWLC